MLQPPPALKKKRDKDTLSLCGCLLPASMSCQLHGWGSTCCPPVLVLHLGLPWQPSEPPCANCRRREAADTI